LSAKETASSVQETILPTAPEPFLSTAATALSGTRTVFSLQEKSGTFLPATETALPSVRATTVH
jgi:hypothetical protein